MCLIRGQKKKQKKKKTADLEDSHLRTVWKFTKRIWFLVDASLLTTQWCFFLKVHVNFAKLVSNINKHAAVMNKEPHEAIQPTGELWNQLFIPISRLPKGCVHSWKLLFEKKIKNVSHQWQYKLNIQGTIFSPLPRLCSLSFQSEAS